MKFKEKKDPILPRTAKKEKEPAPSKKKKKDEGTKKKDEQNDELEKRIEKRKKEKRARRKEEDAEDEKLEEGFIKSEIEFDAAYKGSIGMTVLNLSSRILITVLIAIPYALREAGFGLGILLIIVIGFLTDYTLGLLIKAGEITGENTYVGVVRKVYGKWGVVGVVFKQFFYPFLLMIASNVLIADILVKIVILIANENDISGVEDNFYGRREFIIAVSTVVITLPLSLYKDIGYLSKWAACSLGLLIVLLVFVIIRFTTLDIPEEPSSYSFAEFDVGRAIGILIAAFMAQHSSFLIFDAMIQPTEARQLEATHISVSIAMLGALIFGIMGYATFTENTQANLMNNYCTDDVLMNVGRVLFVLSVYLAFPGEVIVARTVIERTAFRNSQPTPMWRHVFITVLIVFASVGFSFLTDCLSIILELNGVTNAAPLAFVIPPMLMIKLDKGPTCSRKRLPLYIVLVMGVSVTVFGIVLSIKSIIEGVECSHGEEPEFCFSKEITTAEPLNLTTLAFMTT